MRHYIVTMQPGYTLTTDDEDEPAEARICPHGNLWSVTGNQCKDCGENAEYTTEMVMLHQRGRHLKMVEDLDG